MSGPKKPEIRHSYEHHHLAAHRWQSIKPRSDDIVISTSYKAGTTWMQGIVGNIIFHETGLPGSRHELSPWPDMRLTPVDQVLGLLENQTHRRYIKTHLPLDGLPYNKDTKYIVVARDPRDVFMSLLNHWGAYTDEALERLNADGHSFPKMGDDVKAIWKDWMTKGSFEWESDGWPYWSHLHHCKTWWEFRHLPNIEFFHYGDMLADLGKEMRRVAEFIGVDVPEEKWPQLVEACLFKSMKEEAVKTEDPDRPGMFKGGARTFFNKGTNGRWRDVLDEDDLALYHKAMKQTLEPDCADWLENGGPTT